MDTHLLAIEPLIRLTAFAAVFAGMVAWEAAAPRRPRAHPRRVRWTGNLLMAALNSALLRVAFPTAAVAVAIAGEAQGAGLLNHTDLAGWIRLLIGFLALDLAIYLQHVLFHAVPALWRLHRMHHTDLDFDVTTGVRFHPVEVLLSMTIKLGVIAALGIPAVAVLVFEVLLNASSMFNHGNVALRASRDRVLRWVVVTPDMHRVHHSIDPAETNSNFGFNLPWWDRLFGTYRAEPAAGHGGMTIGIEQFRAPRELRFERMLVQPLFGSAGPYPFAR